MSRLRDEALADVGVQFRAARDHAADLKAQLDAANARDNDHVREIELLRQALNAAREQAEEIARARDEAVAQRDAKDAAIIDAVNGKDHAWRRVWEKLVEVGLLSFVGGNGTGVGRALAFIDRLAAERGEAARLRLLERTLREGLKTIGEAHCRDGGCVCCNVDSTLAQSYLDIPVSQ